MQSCSIIIVIVAFVASSRVVHGVRNIRGNRNIHSEQERTENFNSWKRERQLSGRRLINHLDNDIQIQKRNRPTPGLGADQLDEDAQFWEVERQLSGRKLKHPEKNKESADRHRQTSHRMLDRVDEDTKYWDRELGNSRFRRTHEKSLKYNITPERTNDEEEDFFWQKL